MRRNILRAAAIAAGSVIALVPAAVTSASGASDTATVVATPSQVVVLPTGDRVRLARIGGRPTVQVVAAQPSGVAAQFDHTRLNGDQYVFPAEVRPFLGSVLDASLFDVTALAADASPSRIPVTLTVRGGASPHVPGLTITSRTGTSATGYLATSRADALRAALVHAWQTTVRTGASPATLFGGVTKLAAAVRRPATVTPHFPQVTLVVKVLDGKGRPASGGFVGLINTDDGRRYVGFAFYLNGEARVSVPYGHYSAITDVGDFDFQNGTFLDRIIVAGDFEVTRNLQTLTLDARTSRVQPTVSVPKAARQMTKSAELDRESRTVGSLGFGFSFGGDDTYTVTPVSSVEVGALQWLTGYSLAHRASGSEDPDYTYDLSFVDEGSIPRVQDRVVQPYQVATIHSSYYNSAPSDSAFGRGPIYPFQFGGFAELDDLRTPTARTEYVVSRSDAVWFDTLLAAPTFQNFLNGVVDDGLRIYPAGSVQDAEWLHGPLAPAPPEPTPGSSFFFCPACRTSSRLSVFLAPFADTERGHVGSVFILRRGQVATTFSLSRDGHVLVEGDNRIGARVSVPAGDATYQLHLGVRTPIKGTPTSTATVTDLTFHSSARSGVPAPSGWFCGIGQAQTCTVLPLLRITAPLPTDLSDRMPVGANDFVLSVGRFAGGGTATITSAEVSAKIGTGSYHPADLTRLSNGRYRVTLHNPASAAGQPVTLRISAVDDGGNAITQTTRAAYLVADA